MGFHLPATVQPLPNSLSWQATRHFGRLYHFTGAAGSGVVSDHFTGANHAAVKAHYSCLPPRICQLRYGYLSHAVYKSQSGALFVTRLRSIPRGRVRWHKPGGRVSLFTGGTPRSSFIAGLNVILTHNTPGQTRLSLAKAFDQRILFHPGTVDGHIRHRRGAYQPPFLLCQHDGLRLLGDPTPASPVLYTVWGLDTALNSIPLLQCRDQRLDQY